MASPLSIRNKRSTPMTPIFAAIETPLYNYTIMILLLVAMIGVSRKKSWAWLVFTAAFFLLIPNFYGLGSWIMLALGLYCGYVFWNWLKNKND